MEISTNCTFNSTFQDYDTSTAACDDNLNSTGYFTTSTEHSVNIDNRIATLVLFTTIFEFVRAFEYFMCFWANSLTITAVATYDYLHKKSTNILILSLSIADGLLGKRFLVFNNFWSTFCGATDTPVLDFWWRLLCRQPYSYLDACVLHNRLWCDTCWLAAEPISSTYLQAGIGGARNREKLFMKFQCRICIQVEHVLFKHG